MPKPAPYGVLLLDTAAPEDHEIILQHPAASDPPVARFKGLFIAIHGVVQAISGQPVATVAFAAGLRAAFAVREPLLAVLVAPDAVSDHVLRHLWADAVATLEALAGSVRDAARQPALATAVFDAALATAVEMRLPEQLGACFPAAVHYLPAPLSQQVAVSEAVVELETVARPDDLCANNARFCLFVGVCVLHRGVVIHTDLAADLVPDIVRVLRHRALFARTDRSPEELFVVPLYAQAAAREKRYLSVVAQGAQILCALLVPGADADVAPDNLSVDPCYLVDCKHTLERLRTNGVFSSLDQQQSDLTPPSESHAIISFLDFGSFQGYLLSPHSAATAPRTSTVDTFFHTVTVLREIMDDWRRKAAGAAEAEPGTAAAAAPGLDATLGTDAEMSATWLLRSPTKGPKKLGLGDSEYYVTHPELEGFDGMVEFGVTMASVSEVDGTVQSNYVVHGRQSQFSSQQLFVCRHQSVPVSMVETAWRLHFGLHV